MQNFDSQFYLRLVAIIGALVAMIFGCNGVFARLRQKNQGFAPNSLQALAIVFFLPIIVIVALLAGLDPQALAALLGTVAGYILSSPKNEEKKGKADITPED